MSRQIDEQLDQRIQLAAEGRDESAALPAEEVAAYQHLYRALRALPTPSLPAGFAQRMERLTRDLPEQAAVEIWLLRGLLALSLVATLGLGVAMLPALTLLAGKLDVLPWPLLLGCGAALLAAGLVDRVAMARR